MNRIASSNSFFAFTGSRCFSFFCNGCVSCLKMNQKRKSYEYVTAA